MTLILARASAEFILQVADRLVSYRSNGQPFDKISNKSILYIASNAVVAMAYTGDAFLESKPTDHWIAEKLSGNEIKLDEPPAFTCKRVNLQDIGLSFRTITSELNRLQQKSKFSFLISFQGWQWDSKGRLRPLVGTLDRLPSQNIWASQNEPRDWYINGSAMTVAAPRANISQEELTNLSNQLRHKPISEAEMLLVEKIQEVSQRISIVGPHCMSILIPPPSNPHITIRYHLADNSILPTHQKLDNQQEVFAFSPWIISPDSCIPPSQIVGEGFTLTTGIFTINFVSKTPKHPLWLMCHQGQKRPRMP